VGGLCLSFQVLAYREADLETLKTTGSCQSCDLSGADLYEMDLFKANLTGANLKEVDLTLADLTLANLQSADLTGAIFDETNLSGANLRSATLDEDALDEAVFDSDRTRTKLGFKDLKLGMNIVEIAQHCSLHVAKSSAPTCELPQNVDHNPGVKIVAITPTVGECTDQGVGKTYDPMEENQQIDTGGKTRRIESVRTMLGIDATEEIKQVEATCYGEDDKAFTFKFSGGDTTGVLSFLRVDLGLYSTETQQRLIGLLAKKYTRESAYTPADVTAFNRDRSQPLPVIFEGGQVTLSAFGSGTGIQQALTYRNLDDGAKFLKAYGRPAAPDLANLPPVGVDLYPLVGNYALTGIAEKGVNFDYTLQIENIYLELDAVGHQLAGEFTIEWTKGDYSRFRINKIESASEDSLAVRLELIHRGPRANWDKNSDSSLWINFPRLGSGEIGVEGQWTNGANPKAYIKDDFTGQRTRTFWQLAVEKNTPDMYQAYLRMDPNGLYASLARSRLGTSGESLPTPAVAAPGKAIQPESPVDPLVGVWVQERHTGIEWMDTEVDTCYLAVGKDIKGGYRAFAWPIQVLLLRNGIVFPPQSITIGAGAVDEYNWKAEAELGFKVPFHEYANIMKPPATAGDLRIDREGEATTLHSSKPLCWLRLSLSSHKFRRMTSDEIASLEFPEWYTQAIKIGDMPSPVADPETSVASTSGPAAPTPEQEEAVDPLVGVWRIKVLGYSGGGGGTACYLLVGQSNDGTLVGATLEEFSDATISNLTSYYSWFNYKVVPPRTLSIGQREGRNYAWRTEDIGHYPGDQGVFHLTAKNGVITLAEGSDASFHLQSDRDFCRRRFLTSHWGGNVFDKLSLSESAALKFPPELEQKIKDGSLPTPFHPGAQWAGEPSTQPAATTASAAAATKQEEVADPLVGIWLRENSPHFHNNNFCYLFFGSDPDGTIVGSAWDAGFKRVPTFPGLPGYTLKDIGPRTLTIEQRDGRLYDWSTSDNGHYAEDVQRFWLTTNEGSISFTSGADAPFQLQSNRYLCRKERGNETGTVSNFRKLSLSESAALKLHPELEKKFEDGSLPTPFHPGAQWAGESPAEPATDAGATTASAAPVSESDKTVDPLVGIWLEEFPPAPDWFQVAHMGVMDNCYLALGLNSAGVVSGVGWLPELANKKKYREIRSITAQSKLDKHYDWHIKTEIQRVNFLTYSDLNFDWEEKTTSAATSGKLTVDQDQGVLTLRSNTPICTISKKHRGDHVFRRLSLDEIAALDFPKWYTQAVSTGDMPSPIVATEASVAKTLIPKVEKIPQSTDNEPLEFKETGR